MAVDRHFFQSVGGFDPGMLLWGEEQIELSIQVKETHPNPHIFHLLTQGRGMRADEFFHFNSVFYR